MNKEKKKWPMLLDMTKEECKQTLRSFELSTYSKIISVFRAQGELTKEKRKILSDMQSMFSISVERHRAEIRRAVNDEVLNTIAETLAGPNTNIEWAVEGRRLIPLMPRVPPQVAYTALATRMAQLYCGLNAKLPNPCDTAVYGKLDDLGADFEMTDSEDETDGLRFITESMIPQQYNSDQGAYTTLPLSKARLAKEKFKEKKENIEEVNSEASPPSPPPPPPLYPSSLNVSSRMGSGNLSKAASTTTLVVEKRKRKRSLSSDHQPPHSPPPPPTQSPSIGGTGISIGPSQTTVGSIRQLPSISSSLSGSSMKITVTGGMTRSSSSGPINSSTQQKVILVSTSAASGSVSNLYQRSISVPILKSTSQTTSSSSILGGGQVTSQTGGILKGTMPSTTTPATSTSIVSKIRPRFSSSILSQGSSSLPGLPPRPQRPRSNSLILQTEGENSLPRASSGPSLLQTSSSDSGSGISSVSSLNFIGSNALQLRGGQPSVQKSNMQIKQEGGKIIAQTVVSSGTGNSFGSSSLSTPSHGSVPNVVGGRIIGRASIPSSQGLYVVSTSSGTITVVTRTVASASISNPRVVTVNTINNSRPSIVRGQTPTTLMSMGMNQKSVSTIRQPGSIRPVISGPKSNVIVVHKGTIGTGARPVGIQGLRDLSAKIISKSSPQSLTGSINTGTPGILSGTLVVKPSPTATKTISSVISSTKDPTNAVCVSSVSSSSITTTISGSGSNLIVVDLNCDNSSISQSSGSATQTNVLHPPCTTTPSSNVKNGATYHLQTGKISAEAAPSLQAIHAKREFSSSLDMSTVSASSSLPSSFRAFKSPLLISGRDDMELGPEQSSPEGCEDRISISNLVSSSSDVKDDLDTPDEVESRGTAKAGVSTAPSLSMEEEHEEEEEEEEEEDEEEEEEAEDDNDNEWLKVGLEEDEEDPDIDEEEEDRASEASSEKSALIEDDSLENEVDMEDEGPKGPERRAGRGGKLSKAGTSGDPSVSSSTGAGNEDGEIQMLVEKAVEVLQGGDSDQARSLLHKAGLELIDSSNDPDQAGGDGFSISNIAGVSSSSAMLNSGTPLSVATPLRDESSLGSMSELDPATGYFYSPAGENSSSKDCDDSRGDLEETE